MQILTFIDGCKDPSQKYSDQMLSLHPLSTPHKVPNKEQDHCKLKY